MKDSIIAAGKTGSRGFQTCLWSGLVPYVNQLLNKFHKQLSQKGLEHSALSPGCSALKTTESCFFASSFSS